MLHFEILDAKRLQHIDAIKKVGEDFYLAGGTALALQIGHRDSVDFDFFSESNINTVVLWERIQSIFAGVNLLKTQESHNTLSCTVDETIKLSFFGYLYPLVSPILTQDGFNVASLSDIGAMKLSAITSRATIKDYVDLCYILQTISLDELLNSCAMKFPTLDQNLALKSLVYFEDIVEEPIIFMPTFELTRNHMKNTLENVVKEYIARQ